MDCLICKDLERAFESRVSKYIEARSAPYYLVSADACGVQERRDGARQERLGRAPVGMRPLRITVVYPRSCRREPDAKARGRVVALVSWRFCLSCRPNVLVSSPNSSADSKATTQLAQNKGMVLPML
jgi:hypothetical protein